MAGSSGAKVQQFSEIPKNFQKKVWIDAQKSTIYFKVVEFDHFRMQAGLLSFVMSVSEWIEKTNTLGIIVKKESMCLLP